MPGRRAKAILAKEEEKIELNSNRKKNSHEDDAKRRALGIFLTRTDCAFLIESHSTENSRSLSSPSFFFFRDARKIQVGLGRPDVCSSHFPLTHTR